jgi:hypothetical protein
VGEHNAANLVLVLDQEGDIGNHDVDAEQFAFREHEPGVDHENVILPANGHAIHAKFAQSAKRNYLQFTLIHSLPMLADREEWHFTRLGVVGKSLHFLKSNWIPEADPHDHALSYSPAR